MSPLEQLQSDAFERMTAAAYFADIGIYLLRPRSNLSAAQIVEKIEAALNGVAKKGGKAGLAATVLMPLADAPEPNTPGPRLSLRMTVRVQENVLVNMGSAGTLKSCESAGIEVLRLLHRFNPYGVAGVLTADRDALVPNAEFPGKVTYDVNFRALLDLSQDAKVARPEITGTTAAVTITCATSGASIYYSTDDSLPRSGGAGSTAYTVPFSVTAGKRVRAAAYKTSMQASDVTLVQF